MDKIHKACHSIGSAALKDNKRATLVGTHSFGKGVGYHDENVIRGGVLRIADMKYITPSGFDLAGKGISPDILIKKQPGEKTDLQLQAAIENLDKQAEKVRLTNGR